MNSNVPLFGRTAEPRFETAPNLLVTLLPSCHYLQVGALVELEAAARLLPDHEQVLVAAGVTHVFWLA